MFSRLHFFSFTGSTYIACDWQLEVRERYYDIKVATETSNHPSCEVTQATKLHDIYNCMDRFVESERLGQGNTW